MTGSQLLIIVMSIPAFCFAALTVMVKNIVHAVICLIMCLLSLVPIYIALRADFIAAAQVAIYVGAISILIIFAIMFIHDKSSKTITHLNRQTFLGVFVSLMLFATIFVFIYNASTMIPTEKPKTNMTSLQAISQTMFGKQNPKEMTEYFLPVQMASFVIIGALVGAIEMAKKKEDEL
jgi:NADH:ubiquinone oxidoreductase subunit 6 (subunit J)